MAENPVRRDALSKENDSLREENARLQRAIAEMQAKLREPEEIIRAIREGEVDAFVVEGKEEEEIYAVTHYATVYRDLVEESLPFGVWLADRDGKLIYVSRQFLDCTNTDLQEMREKGQFHFLPEETRRAFAGQRARCMEIGAPFNFEYDISCADGTKRAIWTYGILGMSHDGEPCWAGINLDVTEQKLVKEELRLKAEQLKETDRRKDEFLALLGHELRNPMAVIQHGLYVLGESNTDQAKFRQIMQSIMGQVSHLGRLVDDLLDISRISRGTIELRKQRVDLAKIVQQSVASVQSLIDAERHDLAVSLPAEPVWLHADPMRVEQILANLLSNAAKYTEPGGTIRLTATLEDASIVIHVTDNGIGIPQEMLPRVFDLFVQSDRTLDRSQGGLGIGLSVVRTLVALHAGSVTVRSDGPGCGSEFTVRLPVPSQPLPDSDAPQPQTASEQRGSKVRILLAEDSNDLAQILKMTLETWGHDVYVTEDGPSTLEAYRTVRPDVVLLDVGLPGMDGYEVTRRIRENELGNRPVLVAVTGYGQASDRARSQAAGFDHHLVKPADLDALQQILADVGV
jgi:PAS domain S-box-containing protein